MQSSLLLIVYASFWQVLIQVIYGTLDVDPVAAETARSYRLTRLQRAGKGQQAAEEFLRGNRIEKGTVLS